MLQLPDELIQSLQGVKGFDEDAFKKVHESGEQVTSIRLNPSKEIQNTAFRIQNKIPWSTNGFYLEERPSFTADPLFHAGAYYVQEASSMFLEEVLRQTTDLSQPLRVLDLCAAPGGKSTLIQSLISAESLLISNEVIKTRANILSENITKWGAANVFVTSNDPKDFQRLQNYFDVIVVDAPCSGSGLFRKDPDAISEWSEQNVQHCSLRQQRILADILPSLKENGVLIYSTCSYSKKEDEEIAEWLTTESGMESLQLQSDASWNIVETKSSLQGAYGYRFYPDKLKGEGFFISAFKKSQSSISSIDSVKSKKRTEKLTAGETEVLRPYLTDADDLFFIKQNDEVIAIPVHFAADLPLIQSSLYIKKAGVRIGSVIRNELIPHHELALSTLIKADIPAAEVDKETALNYLRRQDINISNYLKGWVLLTYMKLPLGWIKALNNRVNNYYPKEWRILNK